MKELVGDSPFLTAISFHKLLDFYEEQARGADEFLAMKALKILEAQRPYPELREGFSDVKLLEEHAEVITLLLRDTFPPALTDNEIKIAAIPFEDVIFNASERFLKIVHEAGRDFDLKLRNVSEEYKYIMACSLILKMHYGVNVNFQRSVFYDIPDARGIVRNYRVLYNADYLEIFPTERAREITPEDVDLLLNNFDDIDLWKEKFPAGSWILKGFGICNMYDATTENVISDLKTALLGIGTGNHDDFVDDFRKIFSALYGIPDIKVGFCIYDRAEGRFEHKQGKPFSSLMLGDAMELPEEKMLCKGACNTRLLKEKKYFAVADIDKYLEDSEEVSFINIRKQGIKSVILAPVILEDLGLFGIIELGSPRPLELNSINVQRLDDVMPYLVTAITRAKVEEANQVEAIIQQEYTSIHPSVKWKFEREVHHHMRRQLQGVSSSLREIVFDNVYPLYGQIDIKDSSRARNEAIRKDLIIQLSLVKTIMERALEVEALPVYEEILFRLERHLDDILTGLHAGSEQLVLDFLKEEIHPFFDHFRILDTALAESIDAYHNSIDTHYQAVYDHRKNYDESVNLINKRLAALLDRKQAGAQKMFPHYFERYKTDGVEHNMYIGASVAHHRVYSDIYLYNLRLWQLQVMWEMENEYYCMKQELPVKLDVASLLLVHNSPLSIRFRMDEKQFDVDGTYNARYEIIKKRLDKALVKGTEDRVTQKGKIAIVYSSSKDEEEYLRYIRFLQSRNYFSENVEILELEELQGVSGLKALRVEVLYRRGKETATYTYEDLMKEIASSS
ncbi:GAF domain-containing protein [Sinomicrobium soli]|uniref:GAF domain-containing protein n=1 Tax=Sinomicrobium sp. N-1-3-6 TaxID=2219864 RepID=UPI000DCB3ED3|nr:GAF domain-containing protein [Sinomicrobium sp. N-1-3-6]RAV28850.1 GAF domain-containing protein [Sinomicrobium sp. N-1-3-6]